MYVTKETCPYLTWTAVCRDTVTGGADVLIIRGGYFDLVHVMGNMYDGEMRFLDFLHVFV